jgi:hypothetical protein
MKVDWGEGRFRSTFDRAFGVRRWRGELAGYVFSMRSSGRERPRRQEYWRARAGENAPKSSSEVTKKRGIDGEVQPVSEV